jgi:hypothetical protein
MLKKLENNELQSTSSIFHREEAICLKVFHLLHLGGTPLICTHIPSSVAKGSISPFQVLNDTNTPSFFSLMYVVSDMIVLEIGLWGGGNLTRYLNSSISLSCQFHFLSKSICKFTTISSASMSPSSTVSTAQLSKNFTYPLLFSSSYTST